jgi:hypothetical protein
MSWGWKMNEWEWLYIGWLVGAIIFIGMIIYAIFDTQEKVKKILERLPEQKGGKK